jgi:RNA polymerase sigma-70 factor (ECF subfamily)
VALESRTGPAESAPIDSETLFKRYAGFVATFLFRHGARGADLDDLVQDVFLTAHRRGGYRPGAASATTPTATRPPAPSSAAPRPIRRKRWPRRTPRAACRRRST